MGPPNAGESARRTGRPARERDTIRGLDRGRSRALGHRATGPSAVTLPEKMRITARVDAVASLLARVAARQDEATPSVGHEVMTMVRTSLTEILPSVANQLTRAARRAIMRGDERSMARL